MLNVENISKQFPTRGQPLEILRDVSFQLSPGEDLAILGPSGSGKSTLLHLIGTLDQPTSGHLMLNGIDPFSLDEPKLADFRNHHVGFIFQDHHLLPQLSVLENVLLPTLTSGTQTSGIQDRAEELIEQVGLADRREHRPVELSGGERQRVAIARALIHSPALLLADEPTGNLDRKNAMLIGDLLCAMPASNDTMLILVTHSYELAGRISQRYELLDGQLQRQT